MKSVRFRFRYIVAEHVKIPGFGRWQVTRRRGLAPPADLKPCTGDAAKKDPNLPSILTAALVDVRWRCLRGLAMFFPSAFAGVIPCLLRGR